MKMQSTSWAVALTWKGKQVMTLVIGALVIGALLLGSVSPFLAHRYVEELIQYPGATRVIPSQFQLDTLPEGHFGEYDTFYTGDALTRVLDWYLRRFRFASGPTFTGNCLIFTQTTSQLFLWQELSLRLCDHRGGVWIEIGRRMGLTAARP